MVVVGITGTRHGGTENQLFRLEAFIRQARELHHGDCLGVDEQAHRIALGLGVPIIIHPPEDSRARAFCRLAKAVLRPRPYLERNRMIVEACTLLCAVPETRHERLRSGTWSTVRYARKKGVPVELVLP